MSDGYDGYDRYGIYLVPDGIMGDLGASWLGWDVRHAQPAAHPAQGAFDLARVTQTPRIYGFHGTLKPPFFLDKGYSGADLEDATASLCEGLAPVDLAGFEVATLGRFLALIPQGDTRKLSDLAAEIVQRLDKFRAPPTTAEIDRRQASRLSPAQQANLAKWGYPHVMDQFRFHITLTERLDKETRQRALLAAQDHFDTIMNTPFRINDIALVAQRGTAPFEQIARFALQ